MIRCGWCQNSGFVGDKRCVCAGKAKPYFPKKVKKKADDMLKSGHKHDANKFLSETKTGWWVECSCGHTHKIEA